MQLIVPFPKRVGLCKEPMTPKKTQPWMRVLQDLVLALVVESPNFEGKLAAYSLQEQQQSQCQCQALPHSTISNTLKWIQSNKM